MNFNDKRLFKNFSIILFVIYLLLLIWALLLKCNKIEVISDIYLTIGNSNFLDRIYRFYTPISEFFRSLFYYPSKKDIIVDILNIIIFIPLGYFITYFLKDKKLINVLLISFLVTLIIELLQVVLIFGSFQIKDLITNLLGGLIGFYVYRLLFRNSQSKNYKVINILSFITIIILSGVLIFSIINTIKHLDFYISVLLKELKA